MGTITTQDTTPIDWAIYATNSRPPGISDTQWANTLQGLETTFGLTWGNYVSALDSALSIVSPVGGTAYDATQLSTLLVQQVTGYGNCGLSGEVVDVSANQVVTNAQVVAYQSLNNGQSVVRATQTDGAGQFVFTNLPAGSYALYVDGYLSVPPYSYTLTNQANISEITLGVSPAPTFTSPTNAPVHTNELSPALTVDANGTTHLVWQRGSEIWHASVRWLKLGGHGCATGRHWPGAGNYCWIQYPQWSPSCCDGRLGDG